MLVWTLARYHVIGRSILTDQWNCGANVAKSSRPWNKALEQSVKSLTFISLMGVSQVTIEMDRGLLCPKACFSIGSATDFHQLK